MLIGCSVPRERTCLQSSPALPAASRKILAKPIAAVISARHHASCDRPPYTDRTVSSSAPEPYPSIGRVNRERLIQLMNAGTESQHLDYKSTCDPSDTEARVKLAHDIACMAAHGGYLVIGVDGQGRPTGLLTAEQGQDFDQANLMPRIRQWLPPRRDRPDRVALTRTG